MSTRRRPPPTPAPVPPPRPARLARALTAQDSTARCRSAHAADPSVVGSSYASQTTVYPNLTGMATTTPSDPLDRLAHLAERLKLAYTLFELSEQPSVLDGDDGLIREGLQQRDLALGERLHCTALQRDDANGAT